MNSNDENPSKSKLTLTPLDDDLPAQRQTGTATAGLTAVCPKCGYRAKSADDPLLTKHQGLGECPKCGIIPGKYLDKNGKAGSANSQLRATVEKKPTSTKLNQPVSGSRIAVLGGLFVGLVALMLLLKSPGTTPPNTKVAADSAVHPIAASSEQQHVATNQSNDKHLLELNKLTKGLLEKVWTQPNVESKIAMAEEAAVEIANATYGITDPKMMAAYNRCQDGFQRFASGLRTQKEMYETIKSIDDEINALKKRESELSSKVNSELQGGGFMEPLRHNASLTIHGETFSAISRLQDEQRALRREALQVVHPGRGSDICNFYKD